MNSIKYDHIYYRITRYIATAVAIIDAIAVADVAALPVSSIRKAAWRVAPSDSNQRHELALRVGVAVDVALRRRDRGVAGEQLHVAQGTACLRQQPRRPECVGPNVTSNHQGRRPERPA